MYSVQKSSSIIYKIKHTNTKRSKQIIKKNLSSICTIAIEINGTPKGVRL